MISSNGLIIIEMVSSETVDRGTVLFILKVGDLAFDITTGASVQILERIEAWGYVSYRVFDSAKVSVYKVTEEQLNTGIGTNTYDENYLRYVTLV